MKTRDALAALRGALPPLSPGHVWLAGAGPGDPGLLTLDAIAGIVQADVIVHDALVDRRVLALADASTRLEFAGKRGGRPSATQADITRRLIELARAGEKVLRLKGGDPFIFGRGGEEVLALAEAGIPFRVIPGITSGLAALAAASIPATMRGINQAIVLATGHGAEEEHGLDWASLAKAAQPIVFYMAMRNLGLIAGKLMAAGMPDSMPVAVIAGASLEDERTLVSTLSAAAEDVRAAGLGSPAIVVIGEIVALRARLRP